MAKTNVELLSQPFMVYLLFITVELLTKNYWRIHLFFHTGKTYFFRHRDKEEMDAWAGDITEFARKGRKMELSLVM